MRRGARRRPPHRRALHLDLHGAMKWLVPLNRGIARQVDSSIDLGPPAGTAGGEVIMAGRERGGFAAMNREKQREIARRGGRAAHQKGTAHEFTQDEARTAGRKGGVSVSQNREHMSRIGRAGGLSSRAGRRNNSNPGPAASKPDDQSVTEHGGAHPQMP